MKITKNKTFKNTIIAGLIFSLLILVGLCFAYFTGFYIKSKWDFILPIVLFFYSIFIYFYFKKVLKIPDITLSSNEITISFKDEKTIIKWSEISDIEYYDRNGFLRMETIKINTKLSKNPILIYHSHYSNANDLIQTIKYCYDSFTTTKEINLSSFIPLKIHTIRNNEFLSGNFNYISRIPIFSLTSYFPLLGIFGIYKIITTENIIPLSALILMFILIAMSFLIGLLGVNKIGISSKYFVIEHFYFANKRAFRLEDITEVFIEIPMHNSPTSIRIITKDSRTKTFRFANFLKKDFMSLEKLLIEKGINVKNTRFKTNKNHS